MRLINSLHASIHINFQRKGPYRLISSSERKMIDHILSFCSSYLVKKNKRQTFFIRSFWFFSYWSYYLLLLSWRFIYSFFYFFNRKISKIKHIISIIFHIFQVIKYWYDFFFNKQMFVFFSLIKIVLQSNHLSVRL